MIYGIIQLCNDDRHNVVIMFQFTIWPWSPTVRTTWHDTRTNLWCRSNWISVPSKSLLPILL